MGASPHETEKLKQTENSEKKPADSEPIHMSHCDHGWAWMVLLASFIINAVILGVTNSFSVYYTVFLFVFKQSKSDTAWIGSIQLGLMFFIGPLASKLARRFGFRFVTMLGGFISTAGIALSFFATNIYHLYFTYGFLVGFGFGITYTPSLVIVGFYFDKKRPLATALAFTGGGLGPMFFPVFMSRMVKNFGWAGSLLIVSCCAMQIIVCAALYRPLPREAQLEMQRRASRKGKTLTRKAKLKLLLHLFNIICWSMGTTVYFVMIIEFAKTKALTLADAAKMISLFGLCTTISRVVTACCAGFKWLNRMMLYNIGTIGHGVITMLYLTASGWLSFALWSALFGWFYGIKFCLMTSVTTDMFGVENLLIVAGLNAFSGGIGALSGPPIGGALLDATQKFKVPMLYSGFVTLFGAVAYFIAMWINRLQRQEREEEEKRNQIANQDARMSLIVMESISSV